ncbi:MAG: intradiol ring-cleavage dioxygenase [Pseudonocardia sp.]|nr:intradiol ring-cleavage dioxygenase [Pseudonocardia sp.]
MSPANERGTPTYQGRPLPRPGDEVVDQGLGFDVATLLGRRQMLRVLGLGAVTAGLAACGASTGSGTSSTTAATSTGSAATTATGALVEIPEETAGPYPGDGSNGPDVLAESGVVRSDIRSSFGGATGVAEGVPMQLELTITDLAAGKPFTGAAVYVWHCTREGSYSLYSEGLEDQNFLRGVQIVDDTGRVTYTSIVPGCYSGRWPHIHFEVYPDQASITDATNAVATSQIALPQDMCDQVYAQPGYEASVANLAAISLATDNVFGDDSAAHQVATVAGDVTAGYTVSLAVGVDTTTAPSVGQPVGDGAPSGVPGGPGGPPSDGARPSGSPPSR